MKYDVHMYHVVRSKFVGIEADSHEQAIEVVREDDKLRPVETEEAEEVTGWLVDVVGDEEYDNSIGYEYDGVTRDTIRLWYIRAPHPDDIEMDFDLIVRAYSEADAIHLWVEHYKEMIDGLDEIVADARELRIPTKRGVVPWHNNEKVAF